MAFSPLISELIKAFSCLPGVGNKTAQRMVFHLLERNREGGKKLANCLTRTLDAVKHCQRCRTFCETDLCDICNNPKRVDHLLCIVETPADILAIEQSHSFAGRYFVLMGHLSPIDGIGPHELGIPQLKQLLQNSTITEVILATNATVEGQATAYYLAQMIQSLGIKSSRIASGVPKGSELEYIDSATLADALNARQPFAVES